jgi:hypothetical protein
MQHAVRIVDIARRSLALSLTLGLAVPAIAGAMQETQPGGDMVTVPQAPAADLPEAKIILEEAVKAMGGRDVFDAIKSSHIESTLSARGLSLQFDMYTAEPNKLFVRQIIPGMGTGELGINGDVAWRKAPNQPYELVDMKNLVDLSDQAHLFEIVPKLEEQYGMMRTVDRIEFGGADCYKVRLDAKRNAQPEEKNTKYYALFNVDTHLAAGLQNIRPAHDDAPERVSTLYFEDWHPVEDRDLKLYRKLVINEGDAAVTMTYDLVTFNDVDPSVFDIPEEVQALVEAQAAAPRPQEEGEEENAAVSPKMKELLANLLQKDDPDQLRMFVNVLEGQLPSIPEDERAEMEYVIKKLRERIEELEAAGDG